MKQPKALRISDEDIQLVQELCRAHARESFSAFRRFIRPGLTTGWWLREVEQQLQIFYEDFTAGKRPRLAILAPPQHGKTSLANDFTAYVAGRDPDKKTIYASYGEDLGLRANAELQRTISSPRFQEVFPGTRIGVPGWQCTQSVIELVKRNGSFRNTTVNGAITGFQLHLGIIDDPLKGRSEAQSKLVRDRNWNWFTDDFATRFADDGALLITMTRWHIDDLLGRLEKSDLNLRVLRYPAIAEQNERYRRRGEPLFPEFKSLDFLEERRNSMTESSWQALYQQNPIVSGGGIFPINKLQIIPVFDRDKIKYSIRAWDKSATPGGGDYTAGVLMHKIADGTYLIEDVVRGQWSALEREQQIKAIGAADHQRLKDSYSYQIVIEQEPGSGGKESFEATVRNLAGFSVSGDKVTGSKLVRAEPFAAQVQGGNVFLVAGKYVSDFLDEMEMFPNGPHDDQVDAAAMAFARLTEGSRYNSNYDEWV
jgi:predicted phage terminase large subunit-like protein